MLVSSSSSPWVWQSTHRAPGFPCGQRSGGQASQLALAGMPACTRLSIALELWPNLMGPDTRPVSVAVERPLIKWMFVLSCFICRFLCSMRRMGSGGTLVGDLWLPPTGSWLLLTASSTSSRGTLTHTHKNNASSTQVEEAHTHAADLLWTVIYAVWHSIMGLTSSSHVSIFCIALFFLTAPSSPTECLWVNTAWLRKRLAPRPSSPRRLLFMRNGTPSSWPSGETSTSFRRSFKLRHVQ